MEQQMKLERERLQAENAAISKGHDASDDANESASPASTTTTTTFL